MPNYKSYMGLDKLYYAPITQDDSSNYLAGTPALLAPIASVQIDPTTSMKTQFYDNRAADVLTAEGENKLALRVQGLPMQLKAYLLGKVYDAVKGQMFGGGGIPPYVAIGFRALKTDGTYHYWWFLKGRFSTPKDDISTKTDQADAKDIPLEFTAIKTNYEFAQTGSINDSSDRVEGDDADVAVVPATWFGAVQLPTAGSAGAFTCTPSPTDGATGQATTVPITLTFSNALAVDAEKGVTLTRVDTAAIITVTRSLSTDRKTLTLTHAALVATKQYFITVPNVRDIYGQSLTDVVYDFTIA